MFLSVEWERIVRWRCPANLLTLLWIGRLCTCSKFIDRPPVYVKYQTTCFVNENAYLCCLLFHSYRNISVPALCWYRSWIFSMNYPVFPGNLYSFSTGVCRYQCCEWKHISSVCHEFIYPWNIKSISALGRAEILGRNSCLTAAKALVETWHVISASDLPLLTHTLLATYVID